MQRQYDYSVQASNTEWSASVSTDYAWQWHDPNNFTQNLHWSLQATRPTTAFQKNVLKHIIKPKL